MKSEDCKKEMVVVRLNDLVTDVFEERGIELLVNIDSEGKPIKDDGGKILTVGFFISNRFYRYIRVGDDSPAKLFKRCSEVLYEILKKEE